MANPFIGQIALFPFSFAPRGWALCQGQVLSVSSNSSLFSLIGNQFGGDGSQTFALPDLRGRVPVGASDQPPPGFMNYYYVGTSFGAEQATLAPTDGTLPRHSHPVYCTTNRGTTNYPMGNQFATGAAGAPTSPSIVNFYSTQTINCQLGADGEIVAAEGGGGPHNNMQPYLALNYCIALQGTFPPHG
jgi:microcystin-dependent protein